MFCKIIDQIKFMNKIYFWDEWEPPESPIFFTSSQKGQVLPSSSCATLPHFSLPASPAVDQEPLTSVSPLVVQWSLSFHLYLIQDPQGGSEAQLSVWCPASITSDAAAVSLKMGKWALWHRLVQERRDLGPLVPSRIQNSLVLVPFSYLIAAMSATVVLGICTRHMGLQFLCKQHSLSTSWVSLGGLPWVFWPLDEVAQTILK